MKRLSGHTDVSISEATGIHRDRLQRIRRGRSSVTADDIVVLSEFFNVEPASFFMQVEEAVGHFMERNQVISASR
ncbi:MAG: helix-turn-helix transcriptional regulator [Actinomycetota bacterium]